MIHEIVNLKNINQNLENDVKLVSYCIENVDEFSKNKKRECVIVLPGGAYEFLSEREAEPVALKFVAENISSFILYYSIAPKLHYPYPYLDVFAAIAYIRKNADRFNIDPNKICVMGFSAGGHLAATSSGLCHKKEYAQMLNLNLEDIKINGCLLGYPVISTIYGHKITIDHATNNNDPKLMELLSADKLVDENYPKTYLWHTTFDTCVDVKNSLLLANALANHHILFEMHIFPYGEHGQSLASKDVYSDNYFTKEEFEKMKYNTRWIDEAIHFVKEYI